MRFLPFAILLFAAVSPAAVILTNLPEGVGNRSFGTGEWLAFSFKMGPASFSLQSIDLSVANPLNGVGTLDVAVYNDAAGKPGALLQAFNPAALSANQSVSAVNVTPTSAFLLNANATYWIRLNNVEASPAYLFWVGSGGAASNANASSGEMYRSFSQGNSWSFLAAVPSGFALNGNAASAAPQSVPEPSTFLLTASAAALLLLRRRR